MSFTALLTTQHEAASAALAAVSRDVSSYRTLTDDVLLDFVRTAAYEQQLASATVALLAGEIARRSAAILGSGGLAQRTGFRTAIELVKVTTGLPGCEATAAVRVGKLSQEAADAGSLDPQLGTLLDERPWLRGVGDALERGTVSVAAADSIRAGLGEPGDGVSVAALASAVDVLLGDSPILDADRLFVRARRMRDELDAAGIADREAARYEARSLRFIRQADGMARLVWLMDPETAAAIGDVFDRITSPRRGGPRFVENATNPDSVLSHNIMDDPRSTEQLASDVFGGLITAGSTVDPSQLLDNAGPTVRMLVLKEALDENHTDVIVSRALRSGQSNQPQHRARGSASGHGYIEGQLDPVSIDTIERAMCVGIAQPILFDETGAAIDIAPDRRLFSRKQRIALAVKFGGCMFPSCDRPPSWTEAHHINHFVRDNGKTVIADGILLCRHHHLLLHNQGWEIIRTESRYHLVPPARIDPAQTPILLRQRSRAHDDLMKVAG